MRILKSPSIALLGFLSSCIALSGSADLVADDPRIKLVTLILVVVAALFFGGCVWRLSHVDPDPTRRDD